MSRSNILQCRMSTCPRGLATSGSAGKVRHLLTVRLTTFRSTRSIETLMVFQPDQVDFNSWHNPSQAFIEKHVSYPWLTATVHLITNNLLSFYDILMFSMHLFIAICILLIEVFNRLCTFAFSTLSFDTTPYSGTTLYTVSQKISLDHFFVI